MKKINSSLCAETSAVPVVELGAHARRVLNVEVVLFGGSLGKHHVASVELDSDQVSDFYMPNLSSKCRYSYLLREPEGTDQREYITVA